MRKKKKEGKKIDEFTTHIGVLSYVCTVFILWESKGSKYVHLENLAESGHETNVEEKRQFYST